MRRSARCPVVRVLAACAGLLLLASSLVPAAAAQEAAEEQRVTTLRGFVTDAASGQALAGANVALLARGSGDSLEVARGAVADGDGFYQLAQIEPGRYVLQVTYVGYMPRLDTLRLGEERYVRRDLALQAIEEALEAVTVEAKSGPAKVEAGRQRITPAELDRVPTPGPTGDLATYLKTLPGVVSLGDRGGELYVRGGSPSQNQVLMDNVPIYRPFHIVGFFSAFPQDLISSVDFYAGGFPARYSERISSVIDVTMREGNDQAYGGALSLSPFLSGVRVEGPLREGQSSLLVSVRQSAIEETAPVIVGQDLPLTFGEQFAKYQRTGSNSQCSLTGVHTYDRGKIDFESNDVFKWQNYGLGWHCLAFAPNSPTKVETDFGLAYFDNEVGGEDEDPTTTEDVRTAGIWNLYSNVNLSRPLGRHSTFNVGFLARARRSSFELDEMFQRVEDGEEFFITAGAYGGLELEVTENLDVNPSLGLNAPLGFGVSLQPRLRFNWRPFGGDAQSLSGAFGLYEQPLVGISDERDASSVFTLYTPAPFEEEGGVRPQALHAILGWQQRLARGINASVEGYYKRLSELPVPIWDTDARFTTTLDLADGNVYGLDVRATYNREPFYFYLGYGYSWTRYALAQEEFGRFFGEPVQTYHPPHDQRHQLNALASVQLGKWQGSVRWQYASGRPYTPPEGFDAFFDLRELPDPREGLGTPRFLFERPYGARLPAYHRLDVSVERRFDFESVDLSVKAGAINVYDRRNLFYLDLFTFRRVDQLPIVPYLALTIDTL